VTSIDTPGELAQQAQTKGEGIVNLRSKVLGVLVGGLAAAVNVVGGGVAHATQDSTSVNPAGTVRPHSIGAAFTIENKGSHKCLDAEQQLGPSPVVQWGCSPSDPNQNWLMESIPSQPGWFALRNVHNNLCLDLRAGDQNPVVNGTATQTWFCFPDSISTERWQLLPASNAPGFLAFVNQVQGKCLDLSGGSTANGARVQMWDCLGNSNQLWRQG
jgi:hypothetical protein